MCVWVERERKSIGKGFLQVCASVEIAFYDRLAVWLVQNFFFPDGSFYSIKKTLVKLHKIAQRKLYYLKKAIEFV